MSTQTAATGSEPAPAPGAEAPRWGGLVRAEVLRARSRRSLWWLTGLTLLGVLLVSALVFAFTGPVSSADLDAAAQRFLSEQRDYYDQCVADPGIPAADKQEACWIPTAEEARANAIWYTDPQPFTHEDLVALLGFAGGIACVVSLLVGASAGGADWGARTMGLLLSWEPRRLRVLFTRLLVTAVVALLVAGLITGVAWLAGSFLAATHGLDPSLELPTDSGSRLVADTAAARELFLRWLPIGVLAGIGGFAVAMATRSTGWAIGAAIAFVVVVETVVQGLWTWGSQWLVQTNVLAWLQGGTQWVVARRGGPESSESGMVAPDATAPVTIWLSQGRALGTLAVMVVLVVLVAAVLLRRRDVD